MPISLSVVSYLQNRLHVRADESGSVGDQVAQHAGTLLFDSSNTAVLQLCQNLRGRKAQYSTGNSREELRVKGKVWTGEGTRTPLWMR